MSYNDNGDYIATHCKKCDASSKMIHALLEQAEGMRFYSAQLNEEISQLRRQNILLNYDIGNTISTLHSVAFDRRVFLIGIFILLTIDLAVLVILINN